MRHLIQTSPWKIRSDGRYQYDTTIDPESFLNHNWDYFFPKDSIAVVTVEGTEFQRTPEYGIVFDKFNAGYRVDRITLANDFVGSDLREVISVRVHMSNVGFDCSEMDYNVVMKVMELAGAMEDNLARWEVAK